MSKSVSIPDFADGDLRGISASLRTVKQILESMTGQRQDQSKGSPAVYVQATEPKSGKNFFSPGDFWFNTSSKKLYCYNVNYWQVIG